MSNTSFRYDVAPIERYELTPEGYLRLHATIARTGVQHYSNGDGSIRREYRAPEDVALPESLASFAGKSVTDEHPPVLLDSANTKNYQKGFTGSEIVYDNGFVRAIMTITDQELIDKIQRGDATEVSAGYRVSFDANPGTTPDGEPYDGRQTEIIGNHVAVVKTGRAGPQVKLHLDRQDAADPSLISGDSPMTTAKVVFDGADFEVSEGIALAIGKERADAKTSYEAMKKQYDEMCGQASKLKEEMDAMEQKMKGQCDAAEGRADALAAENTSLKADLEAAKAVNVDSLVEDRLALIEKAKPVLDSAYVFSGKSAREIMVDAVKAVRGDSMDLSERSDDYVQAAFDTIALDGRTDSSTGPLRAAVASMAVSAPPAAYRDSLEKAYLRPLTASKGA
jgi:uncharacterized protein